MDTNAKNELLRRKEIVEWQIQIAKDHEIIKKRKIELQEINEQLNIKQK